MFESSDTNTKSHVNRVSVTVTLSDGSVVNVAIKLPMTGKLNDAMNNGDLFLDVVESGGRQSFLSKQAVRSIQLLDAPKAVLNSHRRSSDKTAFNPYAVLGVDKTTAAAEIRQAYHDLARKYHPDRLANYDLPREMMDYAAAMLVRLNLAYEQIGG